MSQERGISRLFIGAAMLCALPVLIPTYPPMADLPQHVASIMVLDEVHFGSYRFAELFAFNWFRPYWFGYGLIWALSYLVGLVWAAKLVVAASIVAFVLSLALLRKEVDAPSLVDWLFLAVPFGFAYEWGFLNFVVCAPLGPLFLITFHRYLAGKVHWGWIMAWVTLLFFGHLLMAAFFCMAASVMALRPPWNIWVVAKRILPMTVTIPMAIGWLVLNVEERNVGNPIQWNLGIERLIRFFPDLFSLDYNLAMMFVATALVGMPFLLGVRPRWSLPTVLPVVFYFLFMMLCPSLIIDNLGTVERFQIFGMMFYGLMLADARVETPAQLPRIAVLVAVLPAIIGIALLGRITIKSIGFERESAEFRALLTYMEPEERALGMVENRNGQFTRTPVYMHFPVWYQVEKKGLVDFNFAQWTSLNSYYKPEHRSGIDQNFAWFPQGFSWQAHGGDNYRYFVVRGSREFVAYVFRDDADKVRPVYEGEGWFLLETLNRTP